MNANEVRERLKEALKDASPQTRTNVEKLVHAIRHENQALYEKMEQALKERDTSIEERHRVVSETAHLKEELTISQRELHAKERALAKMPQHSPDYEPPDYENLQQVKKGHLQLRVKCLHCSLHFIICSWFANLHTPESICCPECGKRGKCIVWAHQSEDFIFQVVPGKDADIMGMTGLK